MKINEINLSTAQLINIEELIYEQMDQIWQVFSTIFKKIYPDRICATLPYSISARLVLANQAFQKLKSVTQNLKQTEYFYSTNAMQASGHMVCVHTSDWHTILQTRARAWFNTNCSQFCGLSQIIIINPME